MKSLVLSLGLILLCACGDINIDAVVDPDVCTDAASCATGETCRTASCVNGTCKFTVKPGFCFVDGDCFNPKQTHPGDSCKSCQPSLIQDGLISKECDPGLVCDTITGECGGGDPPNVPTCQEYCEAYMAACSDVSEYFNEASCLAYCQVQGALPLGTLDDSGTNSVGCRIGRLDLIQANNKPQLCLEAGPTGNDTCGTLCENYCHLSFGNCADQPGQFETRNECLSVCQQMLDGGMQIGVAGDKGGQTLQCRIYHAGVAGDDLSGGATTHCPHASQDGGGVCVDK